MSRADAARRLLADRLPHRRLTRSHSPEETLTLAVETAACVPRDGIVFLIGELGAGKTLFAKGLGRALGLDPDEVTSPSFVIVVEHEGAVTPLVHIDLYRLDEADDEAYEEIGLRDILSGQGMKVVEWAEKLDLERFSCDVAVFIGDAGGDARLVEIYSRDSGRRGKPPCLPCKPLCLP